MIELGKRYLIKKEELSDYIGCPTIIFKEIIISEFSLDNNYVKVKIDEQFKWFLIKNLEIVAELESLESVSKEVWDEVKFRFCEQYKG